MPIASSNDLILAGVQDILEALRNPTPGSPIGPLTDSHVSTLKILSELITGLIQVPKHLHNPVSVPVPPLRVATPQTPSPLRVDPISAPAGPILIPDNAIIVAVPILLALQPAHPIISQDDAPHIVPVEIPSPAPIVIPAPVPAPPISESVSSPAATFENSTGPRERRLEKN